MKNLKTRKKAYSFTILSSIIGLGVVGSVSSYGNIVSRQDKIKEITHFNKNKQPRVQMTKQLDILKSINPYAVDPVAKTVRKNTETSKETVIQKKNLVNKGIKHICGVKTAPKKKNNNIIWIVLGSIFGSMGAVIVVVLLILKLKTKIFSNRLN